METKKLPTEGKTTAIIAHFTIIGAIIAIFMNQEPRNTFAGFYIKQAFGIHIVFYALAYFIGYFDSWMISSAFFLFIFIFWTYSFIGVLQGIYHTVPVLGPKFQIWFKNLSA